MNKECFFDKVNKECWEQRVLGGGRGSQRAAGGRRDGVGGEGFPTSGWEKRGGGEIGARGGEGVGSAAVGGGGGGGGGGGKERHGHGDGGRRLLDGIKEVT